MPGAARVLAGVVVTLGVGGVAGGVCVWLLRLAALAAGERPDAGTTGMLVAVVTFVAALLPGAVATALGRRRTGRALLAAGSVVVATAGAAAQDWQRLSVLSPVALGVTVALYGGLLAVVVGAAAATDWLADAAVRPVGR
ncbi:hypothetical protein ATJ97_1974 [Georgenia soli]|uniref:Major facilitator superfamily (MFS) profile domain-containing protein n=1 Tax=Georgenia soli TaxID=638953 RepID=A0A2A9EKN9_9MICO|nr:hypothetical protein [Georgenia soli]PFG39468.1 hypothetical protein ATJ97_1974 [Georgenia soli]